MLSLAGDIFELIATPSLHEAIAKNATASKYKGNLSVKSFINRGNFA
jgi:hypothetical protein